MAFYVRFIHKEDIPQVTKIDREAFPTEWPSPNYYRELKNPLAHYIVACDNEKKIEEPRAKDVSHKGFSGLALKLKQLFRGNRLQGDESPSSQREYILGFAGIWMMANEAHITNIAVQKNHQRQGIGELLLISLIDLTKRLNANLIILEVRVSNTVAQKLYSKYGFTKIGLRRGYYKDNGEDGVMMALEKIASAPVQENLQQLKQAHSQKWGFANYRIEN